MNYFNYSRVFMSALCCLAEIRISSILLSTVDITGYFECPRMIEKQKQEERKGGGKGECCEERERKKRNTYYHRISRTLKCR